MLIKNYKGNNLRCQSKMLWDQYFYKSCYYLNYSTLRVMSIKIKSLHKIPIPIINRVYKISKCKRWVNDVKMSSHYYKNQRSSYG